MLTNRKLFNIILSCHLKTFSDSSLLSTKNIEVHVENGVKFSVTILVYFEVMELKLLFI